MLGTVLVEIDRVRGLAGIESVSGLDAARHLKLARRQAMAWDLERDAELARLARAGVPAVLLKGAALRLTAYRDSAERDFADIDLLVPGESLEAAVEALVAAGYRAGPAHERALYLKHHHHLVLEKAPGFVVEIHWALDSGSSAFALDAEAFRRDARPLTTPQGVAALVPGPEHMVLHLAHQNLETGFGHLRRLVDVDRTIAGAPAFDWQRLGSEARRMRVESVLALTLRLAERLLQAPVAAGFVASLGVTSVVRAHLALLDPVAVVLEQRGRRRAIQELLMLWCLPDAGARLRELRMMATGERFRWRQGLADWTLPDGPRVRAAAMAKLAGYQLLRYPLGIRQRSAGFWSDPVAHP